VLATAGSAIGLGNIWKFPYIAGEYGGGAFVLAYIVAVILVGIPLLVGEMAIGGIGYGDICGYLCEHYAFCLSSELWI